MNLKNSGWFLLGVLLFLAGGSPLHAQNLAGKILFLQGEVQIIRGGSSFSARQNDPLYIGDRVRTGGDGLVKIILEDNSLLTLDRRSELEISEFLFQPQEKKRSGVFQMLRGRLKALMGRILNVQGSIELRTPTAVAGVRGTYFLVEVDEGGNANFVMFEGELSIRDRLGNTLTLTGGNGVAVGPQGLGVPQPLPPQTLQLLESEMEQGITSTLAQKSTARDSDEVARARMAIQEYQRRSRELGAKKEEGERKGEESMAPPSPPPPPPLPPVNLQSVDPFRQRTVRIKIEFPDVP